MNYPQLIPWTAEAWYAHGYRSGQQTAGWMKLFAQQLMENYRRALPGCPDAEIVARLRASNQNRLAAEPDSTRYPETRGLRELVLAEWNGWRDGADLEEPLWQAFCDKDFLLHREIYRQPIQPGSGRCTYVYFADSDCGPLLGNNLDSSLDEPFAAPHWPGVNPHLNFGTVSSGIFLDEASPEIFPVPIDRMLARHCATTSEALEFLEHYNFFWGPCNALLVDDRHELAILEKSACRVGIRRLSGGFGYVTAMTAETPAFRAYLHDRRSASLQARGLDASSPDARYWAEADHRHELLRELVEESRAKPTFESLRRILQYRGDRGRVCYNGDDLGGGLELEHTLRTTIWKLQDFEAVWWARTSGGMPSFEASPQPISYR